MFSFNWFSCVASIILVRHGCLLMVQCPMCLTYLSLGPLSMYFGFVPMLLSDFFKHLKLNASKFICNSFFLYRLRSYSSQSGGCTLPISDFIPRLTMISGGMPISLQNHALRRPKRSAATAMAYYAWGPC